MSLPSCVSVERERVGDWVGGERRRVRRRERQREKKGERRKEKRKRKRGKREREGASAYALERKREMDSREFLPSRILSSHVRTSFFVAAVCQSRHRKEGSQGRRGEGGR